MGGFCVCGMGVRVGWVDGWAGGWVRGGLITSFNIYISHVKKIQNEERRTSPRGNFLL